MFKITKIEETKYGSYLVKCGNDENFRYDCIYDNFSEIIKEEILWWAKYKYSSKKEFEFDLN